MSFNSLNNQLPQQKLGTKLYRGTVVANADPLHLDRIQVAIPNLFDPELGEVPWIFPIKHSMFGQGVGVGQFGVPPVGSTVVVQLQDNDPQFAYYSGGLLTKGAEVQDLQPGQYRTIDPSGSVLNIDTINNIFDYNHISGVTFHIEQGTLSIVCTKDLAVNISGNSNITTNGDTVVNTSNGTVNASGNLSYKCNTFRVDASVAQFNCPVQTGPLSTPFGGGTATITGGIKNTGGRIESNGIVLETHVHGGVETGGGNTSGPK